jgi:hypothetical protein
MLGENGLRKWAAPEEGKVGCRRERGSWPEGENWPKRFRGKNLLPIFKTFYKFQTNPISIQI